MRNAGIDLGLTPASEGSDSRSESLGGRMDAVLVVSWECPVTGKASRDEEGLRSDSRRSADGSMKTLLEWRGASSWILDG